MSATTSESIELYTSLVDFPTIVSNWAGSQWSWDARFRCPNAVVEGDEREATIALLRRELPNTYDHTKYAQLPAQISALVDATGGLRPGQCVMTDNGRDGAYRYALWWPWTNGVTVSIRLGVVS